MTLLLCMVWGNILISLIYVWLFSFPSTTCSRDCLFTTVYTSFFCHKLTDRWCGGLSLDSVFCSINLCVFLCQYCAILITVVLQYSHFGEIISPVLSFFFWRVLFQLVAFCCSSFKIIFLWILELFKDYSRSVNFRV